MALTKAEARKIMLGVNGMSEAPYFGKPSVFYGEDFVGRVHNKEEAVALRVGTIEMRDVMLEAEPKLFYITELVAARVREIEAAPKKKPRAVKKAVKKKKKA